MLRTRVIPCLLLQGEGLVKTVRFKDPTYVGDPINAVRIFNGLEVDEILLVDIAATVRSSRPNFRLIEYVASECFMPLGYGGGIRSIDDIRTIMSLGVEKFVINAQAVAEPEFVKRAADTFGSQSVVVSIDARRRMLGRYEAYTHNGTRKVGMDPVRLAETVQNAGAGEIILNSIDRDGTMQGFDLDLIRRVTAAVSIPVVACGGAGSLHDLREAVVAGRAAAVAAGSLFVFHGKHRAVLINYPAQSDLRKVLE